jgi:hypothetical protein
VLVVNNKAPHKLEQVFHSTIKHRIPGGREEVNADRSKIFRRVGLFRREEESEALGDFAALAGGDRAG